MSIAVLAALVSSPALADHAVCGSDSVELYAGQHIDIGSVDFSNDENSVSVTYSMTGGWEATEIHVHVACSIDGIPHNRAGNPMIGQFDYNISIPEGTSSYTLDVPYDAISCFSTCGDSLVIAAHAAVQLIGGDGTPIQAETAWGDGTDSPGRSWATYSGYTTYCCTEDPDPTCEQLRTQTQGGWGTTCRGNNPGCYRDSHWDGTFGANGLTIGGGFIMNYSGPDVVEATLPTGGTPGQLTHDYYDSAAPEAGVLVGQVTALSLSVAFDNADPSFGASSSPLASATIVNAGSPCYGWTVQQVLDEGNAVLGGGGTMSPSTINSCLSMINENYVDGNTDEGNVCSAQ